ncbi:MAG TPA: GNAT family N-acetyltransferase [Streptosporangiaceae bacterium]
MQQEPLPADDLTAGEHDMDTDIHAAGSLADQALEVIHHPDDRFYELLADGQFAGLIVYEDADDRYAFTHTFIAEGYRGRGLSWALMRGVMEDVKERHLTVTNYCPVLDRFIEKNPQYAPLIDAGNHRSWPESDRNTSDATRT